VDQLFAKADIAWRMLIVTVNQQPRFEKAILGQLPAFDIFMEVVEMLKALVAERPKLRELQARGAKLFQAVRVSIFVHGPLVIDYLTARNATHR
jgi:hypothetical protein